MKKVENSRIPRPGEPGYWDYIKKSAVVALTKKGKDGRPKSFKTPKHMLEIACEYFMQTDEQPLDKKELIKGGDLAGTVKIVKIEQPYSIKGFEIFCVSRGIIASLAEYKNNWKGQYDEYQEVVDFIEKTIYTQKFNLATIGVYNPAIIMRDLGLVDKVEDLNAKNDKEINVIITEKK